MLNLAVQKSFARAKGKGVAVNTPTSPAEIRAGSTGLATAVPGSGMAIPCCWNASAIGVPLAAALIAAASWALLLGN